MAEANGNTIEFAAEDMLRLRTNIAELREAVENKLPTIKNLLVLIHRTLRADPDVITMLEPEEVAQIVRGMGEDKGVVLEVKAKAAAKKATKNLTLGDL